MTAKIRMAIVDSDRLIRSGLRQVLRAEPRFEIVAETGHGDGALATILRKKPDVAVIGTHPPRMSGLDLVAALNRRKHCPRIVILTASRDERLFNCALNLDILGYVLKENAGAEILACITAVARGSAYVSSSLSHFLPRHRSRAAFLSGMAPGIKNLTPSERRVLKRVAAGRTSREIAAEFGISTRTVESHRTNIATKLKLAGPNCLFRFALEERDALSRLIE